MNPRVPMVLIVTCCCKSPSLLGAALLLGREVQERGSPSRGLQAHRQQPPTRQGATSQGTTNGYGGDKKQGGFTKPKIFYSSAVSCTPRSQNCLTS